MDITSELHKKQYETTDFTRHIKNIDDGLWSYEEYYIDKYLKPFSSTLEIGTGGGRVAFALERQKGFMNITAIDFVEGFIEEASKKAIKLKSGIRFQQGNALNLLFDNESFEQIICFGVVISHLPKRSSRIKLLAEAYRVLKPNGIMLIDAQNYLWRVHPKLLRAIMKVVRFFYNPHEYGETDLPRLGTGRKFDIFFLKPNKPQLHYYYPEELIFDALSIGFGIVEINFSGREREKDKAFYHYFNSPYLHMALRK